MRLTSTFLKPKIGSEVRCSLDDMLAGRYADAVRTLLVERGVLVFRDLAMTTPQQQRVTSFLGELDGAHLTDDADGGVQQVTLDSRLSPAYSAFFPSTFFWHTDGHYANSLHCFGATLRPVVLAGEGGQTEFLNAYAAYEDLSEADRRLIDGVRVVHSRSATMVRATPEAVAEKGAEWSVAPSAVQPLVWQHRSGRRSLLLGNSVSHVVGMHPADSDDLLRRLREHMSRHEYVYAHDWRIGDLLVWDNSGTMHRARPFDPASGRLLHRFSLKGEEPIRPVSC